MLLIEVLETRQIGYFTFEMITIQAEIEGTFSENNYS